MVCLPQFSIRKSNLYATPVTSSSASAPAAPAGLPTEALRARTIATNPPALANIASADTLRRPSLQPSRSSTTPAPVAIPIASASRRFEPAPPPIGTLSPDCLENNHQTTQSFCMCLPLTHLAFLSTLVLSSWRPPWIAALSTTNDPFARPPDHMSISKRHVIRMKKTTHTNHAYARPTIQSSNTPPQHCSPPQTRTVRYGNNHKRPHSTQRVSSRIWADLSHLSQTCPLWTTSSRCLRSSKRCRSRLPLMIGNISTTRAR